MLLLHWYVTYLGDIKNMCRLIIMKILSDVPIYIYMKTILIFYVAKLQIFNTTLY